MEDAGAEESLLDDPRAGEQPAVSPDEIYPVRQDGEIDGTASELLLGDQRTSDSWVSVRKHARLPN